MTRPFRQQIDAGILDRAAALFARRGFAKTSVQDIADAVGLSKAGLLHHFPSKDLLHEAVVEQADRLGLQLMDAVSDLPAGLERDRRCVDLVVDIALAHPGLVALLLSPVTGGGPDEPGDREDAGSMALRAFGVDPTVPPAELDDERVVRVVGALAGLAVLTLAATDHDLTTTWRPLIVATALDALGHGRPGSTTPTPDPIQLEA